MCRWYGSMRSSPDTPRTGLVLPGRQFASSSSPPTPHTSGLRAHGTNRGSRAPGVKVVLPSRQFSSIAPADTLRNKVILLQRRQFSSSSSPATPRTTVVLASRQFSSSSSPDTPRTKVLRKSRQFSSSSSPPTPRTTVVLASHQFSSSSSPDTRAHETPLPMFSILGVLGWVWLLSVCVGLICPKYSLVSVSELYHPLHIDQPK